MTLSTDAQRLIDPGAADIPESSARDRPTIRIRPANIQDAEAVCEIYTHAVLHRTGTFDETPPTLEIMESKMSLIIDRGWPFLIAEVEVAPTTSPSQSRTHIAGYAYAAQFRDRSAYRYTAEDSIYVHPDHPRQGVGHTLMKALIPASREAGFKVLLGVIGDSENEGSIGIHRKFGFEHVGTMKKVGLKFERWVDVVLMQLDLEER